MTTKCELLKLNVNDHVEKKNGLSYLSWAWGWTEILKTDPQANWKPMMFGDSLILSLPDGTAFVGAEVTVNGIARQSILPVMDHKNKAIVNPDAFAVNKNLMRAFAKAMAMHGLGLYIFAGEDIPEETPDNGQYQAFIESHEPGLREAAMQGLEALKSAFKAIEDSNEKARYWKEHGAELKRAAA